MSSRLIQVSKVGGDALVASIVVLFTASIVQAANLPPNTSQTIDASTPVETWQLQNNALLTGTNAQTLQITAAAGSTVNLTGSAVNSASGQGITLSSATALLNNTTVISNAGIGIAGLRNVQSPGGSRISLSNNSMARGLLGGVAGNRFSDISIQNSTVQGTGATSFGVRLLEGSLTASGSSIIGGQNGIIVGNDTAAANVTPSSIILDGTRVEGTTGSSIIVGYAPQTTQARANIEVRNGSTLVSGNNTVVQVSNGASATLLVDNSALTGNVVVDQGSSGSVTLQNNASLTGDMQNVNTATLNNQAQMRGNVLGANSVLIDNGSTLTGNLQDIGSATLNHLSSMTGNVTAASGSASSLTLDNGASLTGQVNNVANFSISNQALWQMTDNQSVNNLTLDGGRVRLGSNQEYFQLNVANLSGNGTFEMNTDFNQRITDLLNVTGSASGSHQLLVASSGADPTSDVPIKVVQTAGGSAQFGLVNGPVDVGAFTYGLVKKGEDWYLQSDREVVSTPTRSVLAIFGTAPTLIYGEMATLNNRMGDLRVNGGQTGGWVRSFGSRYSIGGNAYGGGYSQTQAGISMGVDTPVQIAGERVLLGTFVGYSKSNLDLSRGSSAEIGSTSLGVYGTWLGDSGYYLDTLAKLNRFRNEAKVALSDGTQTKGNYNNLGASASVEFGKHIELNSDYYIEPFTQWQLAAVQGKGYSLDNGLRADADTTRSMLGKAGINAGRSMTLANGSKLQPHLTVAAVREFARNNEVRVNDNTFNNDLSGNRVELGAGVSWTLNDRWQLHAEVDTSKGDGVTKDYGLNMGVHMRF
ncbi:MULTISPECIES: autotransporter outer membrane beta-barrel domain-containing protein [unclassified Pseudomonas]|uniref:autotransporter outer membrane beta-barrel domain-containing protein n=1 Tax=unclassified Pseudomonas TaxID=196821 RepID=UPI002AC8AB39|nr:MULTISPECIES: autotransporter outer membrane beta-barrel domain-containing protein [unclassified Pseudomonas]MEB0045271.1 autotransporter outer membrane beta-barrel domain-containing protein [Pseudomonas sp. Dout3]MEB0096373.1 autotransporter outer membrane beta-barrel domain-containing protein [Pseudomonas sp. DC1.2]WPX61331.1 autotransporter outer membrane beta-barrel domain-containing protein [Pseudomonas sp. DC1.2]